MNEKRVTPQQTKNIKVAHHLNRGQIVVWRGVKEELFFSVYHDQNRENVDVWLSPQEAREFARALLEIIGE